MIFIIAVGVLLSFSIIFETLGIWARVEGALRGHAASGYSSHVRIATLGRFFTLLAGPLIGFAVDMGHNASSILFLGGVSFIFVYFFIFLFSKVGYKYFYIVYCKINSLKRVQIPAQYDVKIILDDFPFKFQVAVAFSLTAIGVIIVNFVASFYPEYRASIVQMSALVTTVGTLVHIFYVDKRLSYTADECSRDLIILVVTYLDMRIKISLFLAIVFFSISFFMFKMGF